MKNNKSLVLALVGLAIIILVGVYLYQTDPFAEPEQTATQEQTSPGSETAAERGDDTATKDAATKAGPETGEASQAAQADKVPTFDVVRVEPDGSTLIAGQAEPGTKVQVVNNGQVIAEADAGLSGDFVAVVEDALKPGDHEIVLRSLGENDTAAQSEEVATISVPEDEPAELLVMVTKPGEASRILTRPEGEPDVKAETEMAAAEPAAADEGQSGSAKGTAAAELAQQTADASGATNEQPADDTAQAAAKDDGASEGTETALAESGSVNEEPTDQAAAPASSDEEKVAMAAPEPAQKSEAVVAAQPALRIDAVEIEGGRMFVAGSATPGAEVSVYANGEPIGTSRVSPTGRFLVEADKDIAVGNHTISADLTMRGNVAPALRVAVPFTRPEGEMVAAVAASQADGAGNGVQAADAGGKPDEEQVAQAADTATEMSKTAGSEPKQGTSAASQDGTVEPAAETVAEAQQEPVIEQGSADDTQAEPVQEVEVASAAPAADGTETVVQAALEPRDSSVIIRRGDTLWQISRRIYGRGVRYTTIYLANADQIKNPDMIEPGQIFAVPDEPLDNAEELHRERVRGR